MTTCKIERCALPVHGRELCSMHYQRWKKYGDVDAERPRRVNPHRSALGKSGYMRVWAPDHPLAMSDGYVLEHRKVLHDAGVAVPKGVQVHHINGDKGDNRLENLEVMTESEHHRRHIAEAAAVENQHGRWFTGEVRTCSVAGCEQRVKARGLCNPHYMTWWRGCDERD